MGASASTITTTESTDNSKAIARANTPSAHISTAVTATNEMATISSNPAIAPSPSSSISSSSDSNSQDASWTGAAARAATAMLQGVSRVGSAMFRAPIKVFRQNKFDLAEGHQPVLQQAQYLKSSGMAAAGGATTTEDAVVTAAAGKKKTKKPSALKVLMAEQGRSSTLLKQVLPSLVANIAVGTVMFKTFDSTIDFFARKRFSGEVPAWMCSSCLSNGNLPLQSPSSSQSSSFNAAYVGPDVLIAGALSGAAQSVLVVPMENSSSWIRQKYALLQHRMTQTAVADAVKASSSSVSVSTVEATAMNFVPPTPPSANIATMNLANSIREMVTGKAPTALFPTHVPTSDPSSLAAAAPSLSVRPPSSLFSQLTFRMTRDAIGLSIFFFAFEKIHSSMKVVPFRWLEMQEKQNPTSAIPNRAAVAIASTASATAAEPSAYELGTFLAWDCVSVLTAGAIAGYGYHVASWPFFQVLQHIETKQLNHLLSSPFTPPSPGQFSAWGELRRVQQNGGFKALFEGVFGEKTSAKTSATQALKRPKLFNPLVLGLVVYTLTKTEHQTHQIQEWRAARSATKHQFA